MEDQEAFLETSYTPRVIDKPPHSRKDGISSASGIEQDILGMAVAKGLGFVADTFLKLVE